MIHSSLKTIFTDPELNRPKRFNLCIELLLIYSWNMIRFTSSDFTRWYGNKLLNIQTINRNTKTVYFNFHLSKTTYFVDFLKMFSFNVIFFLTHFAFFIICFIRVVYYIVLLLIVSYFSHWILGSTLKQQNKTQNTLYEKQVCRWNHIEQCTKYMENQIVHCNIH